MVHHWLSRLLKRYSQAGLSKRGSGVVRRRLQVEWLEDRTLLTGPLSFSAMSYPYVSDAPSTLFADTATSIVVGSQGGSLYRYNEVTNKWAQLPTSIKIGAAIETINFTPTAGKWVIGTSDGKVGHLYQYDSITGTTVQASTTSNFGIFTSVYIPQVETLIFRTWQGDVYSTTDGLHFARLASPPGEAVYSSLRTSTGVLYMGGEDAAQTPLKSTDNGVTWTPTNDGTLKGNTTGLAEATNGDILVAKTSTTGAILSRINPSTGVISTSASGLPGGQAGQVISLGNSLELCTVKKHAPYLSTDDGHTWTATSLPFGEGGHFGKTVSNVYYWLGGTIYKSAIPAPAGGPVAHVSGPSSGVPGQPRTFIFSATDPSPTDQAAGYSYAITWGDGTSQTIAATANNGAGVSVDHTYTAPPKSGSTYTVTVKATGVDDNLTSAAVTSAIMVQSVLMEGNTLAVGGTMGNDTITLSPSDTTGDINVHLNDRSLGNFKPTDHILVYGQSGKDIIRLASTKFGGTTYYISVPAFLYGGGTSGDVLDARGSTANNVLIGGGGPNILYGGLGRDLLIAGLGASTLEAGRGDDILIGGTTNYDLSSTSATYNQKLASLETIMAEWGSADSYATRIKDLLIGGGLNVSHLRNTSTVHASGEVDTLTGATGAALDWFFAGVTDLVKNKKTNEVQTLIF